MKKPEGSTVAIALGAGIAIGVIGPGNILGQFGLEFGKEEKPGIQKGESTITSIEKTKIDIALKASGPSNVEIVEEHEYKTPDRVIGRLVTAVANKVAKHCVEVSQTGSVLLGTENGGVTREVTTRTIRTADGETKTIPSIKVKIDTDHLYSKSIDLTPAKTSDGKLGADICDGWASQRSKDGVSQQTAKGTFVAQKVFESSCVRATRRYLGGAVISNVRSDYRDMAAELRSDGELRVAQKYEQRAKAPMEAVFIDNGAEITPQQVNLRKRDDFSKEQIAELYGIKADNLKIKASSCKLSGDALEQGVEIEKESVPNTPPGTPPKPAL